MALAARLLAFGAALLLFGCGGGGSGAVAIAFQIAAVTPPDASANVALRAQVILFFSEPVDPATVDGQAVWVEVETGNRVPGTLEVPPLNPSQVRFTPLQDYAPFASHRIHVAPTVRDRDGDLLDRAYTFVFQAVEQGPTLPVQSQVEDRGDLLRVGRWFHRMTLLPDGRLLVAGGYTGANTTAATGELLDAAAGTSTPAANAMARSRAGHVQVLLQDGRVLIAGGEETDSPFVPLAQCQLFDPATDMFGPAATMSFPRSFAHGARLQDGRVLVTGGQDADGGGVIFRDDAEIYDPATNSWTPVAGTMEAGRATHFGAVVAGGDVVLVGGTVGAISAIRFDGAGFVATGTPQAAHFFGAGTLLPDGRLFVAGGTDSLGVTIFDDAFGFLQTVNLLPDERVFATATAFADGRVVIAGGVDFTTVPPLIHQTLDLLFPIEGTGRIFRVPGVLLPRPVTHHAAARGPAGRIWLTGGLPSDVSSAALRQVTVIRPE